MRDGSGTCRGPTWIATVVGHVALDVGIGLHGEMRKGAWQGRCLALTVDGIRHGGGCGGRGW
jgi:hypothetical protein